jgi:hypothetical protein
MERFVIDYQNFSSLLSGIGVVLFPESADEKGKFAYLSSAAGHGFSLYESPGLIYYSITDGQTQSSPLSGSLGSKERVEDVFEIFRSGNPLALIDEGYANHSLLDLPLHPDGLVLRKRHRRH